MERRDRSAIVSLFASEVAQGELRLRGAPARHARVRRVRPGDSVRLLDGRGRVASGRALEILKDEMTVSVERVVEEPRPSTLEVIVPIADRDRMLLAAEKCVELGVTAWRPAYFGRSRSVAPRGEGDRFHEKVVMRMRSALEQSGGAWLPEMHTDAEAAHAMHSIPAVYTRLLLDAGGSPVAPFVSNGPMAITVGPEGGLEHDELARAREGGWQLASLGDTILRFETAVIVGAAVIRATQFSLSRT